MKIQDESRYITKNLDGPRLEPFATLCKSDFVYEKAEVNLQWFDILFSQREELLKRNMVQ